jgi:hemolysin III
LEPQDNIHLLGIADPVAAGTHLAAFFAQLAGLPILLRRTADDAGRRFLVLVYSITSLVQFAASVAYHAWSGDPATRLALRRLDHATIYLLIAGTFTPLTGAQLKGGLRRFVLATTWAFAICGVVLKVFFFGSISETLDVSFYLAAGWFGIVPTFIIFMKGEHRTTAYIMLGAMFYTVGALCELEGWPLIVPGIFNFHEVFHVCVMAASATFFVAVWRCTGPGPEHHHVRVADPASRGDPS